MRLAPALLAVFALAACSESRPANPPAAGTPPAATATEAAAKTAEVGRPDAAGVVRVEATRDGFHPSRIEAKAGQPLKLIFTRTEVKTCMSEAVFPDLGIRKELPVNQPVEITVTPEAGKEIVFQCPMGMGKSVIVGIP
jgi:plastocyanin domain-containing protein